MNKYLHIPVNIIVDGIKVVEEIKKVVRELGINAQITEHKSMVPIFHKYGAANTIRNLSNNKVFLPSGGSIVIDHAEAMVCIDINSSSADEGDLSSNSHKVNMEAAEEIARQIRMRDLSGIIAIDFIDMNSSDKIAAVEGKFKEAIKLDTPLIKLAPINEFCVMLLSRPRSNLNLHEYLYTSCEHCGSRGFRKTMQNLVTNIFYEIRLSIATHHSPLVTVECESKVAFYILNQMRKVLVKLEESGSSIIIKSNEALINSFCVMPQGAYNIPKKLVDIPKKVVPVRHYLPQIHQIWPSPYISLMDDQGSIVISMH
jgi:ribonuclease E